MTEIVLPFSQWYGAQCEVRFRAAALALLLTLSVPSRAEDRAVKMRIAPVYPRWPSV